MASTAEALYKRQAAEAAVELIEDGMVVGLGTGSTAAFAIDALAAKVEAGLSIVGIPTSERSAERARAQGIPLATFAQHRRISITIDGADEIEEGSLDLIKGLGGALLREKIVASATDRLIIIADDSKLVPRLGSRGPLPVEVVPFGWEVTADRLAALARRVTRRLDRTGGPFLTDGGHFILDCTFEPITDAPGLARALDRIVGVVETGLFIAMAQTAILAGADGVRTLTRREIGVGSAGGAA